MPDDIKKKFLEAYDAYADAIYRHCFFRVFSKARAEELTQETFMRAWQYMGEGKKIDNLRAFLYRVATNLIIDDSRKKKEQSLDILLAESSAFEPSSDDHAAMEQRVFIKEVMAEMANIPEDYREVLIMRYVDDLEPREIAEILGTTPNNISVRLNRALKALRATIQKNDI